MTSQPPRYDQVIIDTIQFEVDREQRIGRAIIDYDRHLISGRRDSEQVKVGIVAIWQNPVNGDAVKAHLQIDTRNIQQRLFYATMMNRGYHRCDKNSMHLLAGPRSGQQPLIRYGINYEGTTAYQGVDQADNYRDYWIYDSKSLAIKAMIETASRYGIAIGGLEDVNFNHFPDTLLSSFGFTMVPDLFGRSIPMWKGNPAEVFSTGSYVGRDRMKERAIAFLQALENAMRKDAA